MLEIKPITFREASQFVNEHHRHHGSTVGCKFCIEDEKLVGVAICGRPVSRNLDDGTVCEVNRLCTDGTFNACSKLYGACSRVAKEMGYKKIITYILDSESGTSLKASGWKKEIDTQGNRDWSCKSRPRTTTAPTCAKQRWGKWLK